MHYANAPFSRLGELVMLNRVRMDEESASDTNSFISSEADDLPTPDLQKLDLSSGPSMSTVYGSSEDLKGSENRPSSLSDHPSRSGSSSSISQFFHRRKSSQGGSSSDQEHKKKAGEDHLCRWLQGGNVIYKSVGLGLMDLTVGMKVIEFAKQKGIGTLIDGF